MRTVTLSRRRLGTEPLPLPGGESFDPARARAVFDERGLPDGFPFVVDDDGGLQGCRFLNQYLVEAYDQRAFDLQNMRDHRIYALARLLRFVRQDRAERLAEAAGEAVDEWVARHGEPKVDLTEVTREDLIAYRDSRQREVESSAWEQERGCLGSFFWYATDRGWMKADPTPRWAGRDTLRDRNRKTRMSKFLTGPQTAHFLAVGLRGDGADPDDQPARPERDFSFGTLLGSSGLRRREGALLLDNEIPPLVHMPADGVHVFRRKGKKGVVRNIYVTAEVAQAVDLYRLTERADIVDRHQRSLRRLRREGLLLEVEDVIGDRDEAAVVIGGEVRSTVLLTDEERARAVRITDEGTIEPLGLFLGRGLPMNLRYWNQLFVDAHRRVDEHGGDLRPPAHIRVGPHTMRHTFTVRILAALMDEGRERSDDPYLLLANPMVTVQQLLGHADPVTTREYLFAAEVWHDEVPRALRSIAAENVGKTEHGSLSSPCARAVLTGRCPDGCPGSDLHG